MSYCIVDCETPLIGSTGVLSIDKIFCIAVKSGDNPTKVFTYTYHPMSSGNLRGALAYINSHKYVVGHNICKFDLRVIENLIGPITAKPIDTLIDAKLIYPKDTLLSIDYTTSIPKSLYGSYSLEAFGHRLGEHKLQFSQFDRMTTYMLTYCIQDVETTYHLFNHLTSQPNYPPENVRTLEYDVAKIIFFQQEYGFYFDIEKAKALALNMKFRKMNIEHKLQAVFRPKFLADGNPITPAKARRNKVYVPTTMPFHLRFIHPLPRDKHGRYKFTKNRFKWFTTPHTFHYTYTIGEYQPIKLTKFDPGSRHKIRHWLKTDLNFEFDTFTEKGTPKVEAESLEGMEHESGKLMKEYLKLVKDLSQLDTGEGSLIRNYRPHNSTLTSNIDTNGTVTGRFTSSSINLNQIPAQAEFRELFNAPTYYNIDENLAKELVKYE